MTHLLFDWLIENQLLLSALLLSFILLEKYSLGLLRASFVYQLICLIPMAILLANIPSTIKPFQNSTIAHYLVKPDLNFVSDFWLSWLSVYLLISAGLVSAVLVIHYRFLQKLQITPLTLEQQLRINIPTTVYQSANVTTPMVLGIFKSTLVLPKNYQAQFSTAALALIIEHELVHMRRKDNLANIVFLFATILVWFNPLAWFAYASFRRLQELSCDQKVLENKTKEQHILYSKALIDCVTNAPSKMMAYSHYGDKKMILQRLNNIKQNGQHSRLAKGGLLLLAGVLLSTIVIAKPPIAANSAEEDVRPIVRVAPVYPTMAAAKGITGTVTLQYDISPAGIPTNIIVVSAQPERIFNREAKKALAKWKYKPSATGYQDVLVQLEFALD